MASFIASGSHLHVARLASSPKRPYLLGANNLAAEELGGGVGEVLHVVHDGLGGIAACCLLEVVDAAPLEGGLDSVRGVISKLDDLFFCQPVLPKQIVQWGDWRSIPSRT